MENHMKITTLRSAIIAALTCACLATVLLLNRARRPGQAAALLMVVMHVQILISVYRFGFRSGRDYR